MLSEEVVSISSLKYIPGCQLAYTATTVAVMLAKEFDNTDINILSSFFCAIGDALAIIASQQQACSEAEVKTTE